MGGLSCWSIPRCLSGNLSGSALLPGTLSYIMAPLATACSGGVAYALDPGLCPKLALIFFYGSGSLVSWLGGLVPGLLATALSAVSFLLFFQPAGPLRVTENNAGIALVVFIVTSTFSAVGLSSVRRARRSAELARDTHAQSEDRFRRMVTAANDAIITLDAEHKITLFNTGAEAIFGYSAPEMLGRTLDPIIPARFREVYRRHIDSFGATVVNTRNMGTERVLLGLRRSGEEFPIEAQISQVEVDGQKLYTVILRDVTERKRAEAERERLLATAERAWQEAERALKVVRQVQSITQTALMDLPFARLVEELVGRVRSALEADVAVILLEEDGVLHARAAVGLEREVRKGLRMPVGSGIEGRIAKERCPLVVNNVQCQDKPYTEHLRKRGVHSLVGVQLLSEGSRVLGVLEVGCFRPRKFSDDDVRLLQLAAERVALAIERAARIEAHQVCDTLEASNRKKDEFLAMLSHELRNPLAAILNALASATLGQPQPPREVEIALRQAEQLRRLVDDLLDVTRITRGSITLQKQGGSLVHIIERAVETAGALIDARGLRLSVELPAEPLPVEADPARLEQVFVNLLSNAAKYTEPGGHIYLVARRRVDRVGVLIRDTGIGIAPEMLPRIWDLFTQADQALDRAQGGLGVGLTVVRRLVELHGGSIEARSEGLGKGAEFEVTIPLSLGRTAETRVLAPTSSRASQTGTRILLVEDNRDAAEALSTLLERLGHCVRVVHDGTAAIAAAQCNAPDVMLVDIGLPDMDGYEVARRVRLEPILDQVVVAALTGYGQKEDRQRAIAAGFDYHLVKPVNAEVLKRMLSHFVDRGAEDRPMLH
jgi:PAS domain S-box-containing protein